MHHEGKNWFKEGKCPLFVTKSLASLPNNISLGKKWLFDGEKNGYCQWLSSSKFDIAAFFWANFLWNNHTLHFSLKISILPSFSYFYVESGNCFFYILTNTVTVPMEMSESLLWLKKGENSNLKLTQNQLRLL